jgi:hypothetical protein
MRVERVGRTDHRRPTAVAAAALLLVLIAVAKPWGLLDLGASVSGLSPLAGDSAALALLTPSGSPGPTPIPTPTGDQVPCLAPSGWRLATLEVGPLGDSRSWIVVSPVAAASPLDAIAAITLRTDGVVALGFCGPGASQASTSSRIVGAWRVATADSAGRAADALQLAPVPGADAGLAPLWAVLYLAPTADGAASASATAAASAAFDLGTSRWTSGHYVFEVADDGAPPVWFALDLLDVSA